MPVETRAGRPVFSQTSGNGTRPALLIHCGLANSGIWAGMAAGLDDALRMTAFDLPGHGQSGDWDDEADYLTLSAQIAASFIDAPVDLIGHSFGALVALKLAEAAPDAIRTLTLIEPVLFAAARGFPEWDDELTASAGIDAALGRGDLQEAAQGFVARWGAGRPWDEMDAAQQARMVRRMRIIHATSRILRNDTGGLLDAGALERLQMPAMIVCGTRSPPIIGRIAEEIAARLPDVGVAEVPGAGHMLPLSHPEALAGLVSVQLDRG